jgi:hypothetical protein
MISTDTNKRTEFNCGSRRVKLFQLVLFFTQCWLKKELKYHLHHRSCRCPLLTSTFYVCAGSPVCLSLCLCVCRVTCLSVSPSVCVPGHLSVCLYVSPFVFASTMSLCLYVCRVTCLSVSLSVCVPGHLSVCLSVCVCAGSLVCLSLCLCVCRVTCLSVFPSVCVPGHLSVCLYVSPFVFASTV